MITNTYKRGFTLIEVLAVVVIIAALATIAVPQYQRAVYKSRYHALLPVAQAVYEGNESYFLGHRKYATDLSLLDVEGQNQYPDGTTVQLRSDGNYSYVLATRAGLNNNYIVYQSHSPNFASGIHCEAKQGDSLAQWLCEKAMKGTKTSKGSITSGYDVYILQGKASDGNFTTDYVNTSSISLNGGDTCTANQANECQNLNASGSECTAQGVNNGCAGSSYTDGSTCSTVNGGKQGCSRSQFDDSTCAAGSESGGTKPTAGCQFSIFTNGAKCEVWQNAGTAADNTACGGSSKGGKTDTTGTNSAQYWDHSECITYGSNYGCGRSNYHGYSGCTSYVTNGGCGNSSYDDHSFCKAVSGNACDKSKFTNGSVCVALASGACPDGTYDSTSYCMGEEGSPYSYCPNGTPAPPATEGGVTTGTKWRDCTAAEKAAAVAAGYPSNMKCHNN